MQRTDFERYVPDPLNMTQSIPRTVIVHVNNARDMRPNSPAYCNTAHDGGPKCLRRDPQKHNPLSPHRENPTYASWQ